MITEAKPTRGRPRKQPETVKVRAVVRVFPGNDVIIRPGEEGVVSVEQARLWQEAGAVKIVI